MRLMLLSLFLVLVPACGNEPRLVEGPNSDGGDGGGCMTDRDCAGATPRCDRNALQCVPCLQMNDNCPKGQRCVATNGSFACSSACVTDGDCPKSDAGNPTSCCNGACIDTSSDTLSCGRCGAACLTPANASPGCHDGMCAIGTCNLGFLDCDRSAANGCEVSAGSDAKNCGACGKSCTSGANQSSTCMNGACTATCQAGFGDCDGNAVNGCETSTTTDAKNCGACGTACALANASSACKAGACVVDRCNQGFEDCNGAAMDGCEADVKQDINHCGNCMKVCAAASGVPGCRDGSCVIASCNMGFTDCDGLVINGCEVVTATDANNCGACGNRCMGNNSMQACQMSQCIITSCAQSYADCDRKPATGCEINVATDRMNCGGCGKVCPVPAHATATCGGGMCGISCAVGFSDCNNDPMDGCETDVTTVQNCGRCGMACMAPANATAECKAGMCGVGMCNNLFGDCDGNGANGCEKDLSTDMANCGKCGAICALANAQGACLGGQCGLLQCNQGFANCDMNPANGCEVNLGTDAGNCGACGNKCPQGNSCSGGQCKMSMCLRIGWQQGAGNWTCPNGLRLPTINEYAVVAPCITQQDLAMFNSMNDIGISVGGCNCKWNANWCNQPSIETMRQGRCCGDLQQLMICVN